MTSEDYIDENPEISTREAARIMAEHGVDTMFVRDYADRLDYLIDTTNQVARGESTASATRASGCHWCLFNTSTGENHGTHH